MNNYSFMIVDVGQVSRGNVGASVPLVRPIGAPVFWKNRDWPCGLVFGVAPGGLNCSGRIYCRYRTSGTLAPTSIATLLRPDTLPVKNSLPLQVPAPAPRRTTDADAALPRRRGIHPPGS